MSLTITVTAEDIAAGVRGSVFSCPIAHAVMRASGETLVEVGGHIVYDEDAMPLGWLPGNAQQFVCDFDADRPVKPFMFVLLSGTEGN